MTDDITRQPTNSAVNAANEMRDHGTFEPPVWNNPLMEDVPLTPEAATFFKDLAAWQLNQLDQYRPHHGILTDWEITGLCTPGVMPWLKAPMLQPFVGQQVKERDRYDYTNAVNPPSSDAREKERIISYGVSAFGYDCRLAPEYKIFTNATNDGGVIDPLAFKEDAYLTKTGDYCVIPPNSYILGHTVEYFTMPQDVMSICLGKSTYARCGIAVNVTPIEPGWEGHVTLEISNQTPLPIKVYANMGICQFLFFRGFRPKETYSDKGGKYMGQRGITPARV